MIKSVIFHIDMDAFFASCHIMQNPDLLTKPVVVSQTNRRSTILTANYVARANNINSGMPLFMAINKYPKLIVMQPDFSLYRRISKAIFDMISRFFSKTIEIASIDECYLDVTNIYNKYGGMSKCAEVIKDMIWKKFKITASIGISYTKFLAKMASEMDKPNGITIISETNLANKLWPLPISKMYGIGLKTQKELSYYGIRTIRDLAFSDLNNFKHLRIYKTITKLILEARGESESAVNINKSSKSVGSELTFPDYIDNYLEIKTQLFELAKRISKELKLKMIKGNVLCLIIKYDNFKRLTYQVKIKKFTNSVDLIFSQILSIFDYNWNSMPVRLLGISIRGLIKESQIYNQLNINNINNQINFNSVSNLIEKIHKEKPDWNVCLGIEITGHKKQGSDNNEL